LPAQQANSSHSDLRNNQEYTIDKSSLGASGSYYVKKKNALARNGRTWPAFRHVFVTKLLRCKGICYERAMGHIGYMEQEQWSYQN
jgi:transposase